MLKSMSKPGMFKEKSRATLPKKAASEAQTQVLGALLWGKTAPLQEACRRLTQDVAGERRAPPSAIPTPGLATPPEGKP
ncbi:hypothetical protein TcasGA2_TC010583 [Tribolium castaneum]|uniref:Uncharacterized protein n=1 Tax=Tribolium castaneum TaxID=7070 RepID=D6WUC3_TRICA|nr:hypothetical protein TcasGA2_TC010583 [Tribolium castaneum]